jgi:hypothetical protein
MATSGAMSDMTYIPSQPPLQKNKADIILTGSGEKAVQYSKDDESGNRSYTAYSNNQYPRGACSYHRQGSNRRVFR